MVPAAGWGTVTPLVTVVTATWGRPRTILERAIPSLAAQDYKPLQHIIVTDGFDPGLNEVLHGAGYSEDSPDRRLVWLGRNQSHPDMVHGGVGVIPRQVGAWLAAGEYITYLDDDNTLLPHHISTLAAALADSGADFACCRWHEGHEGGGISGSEPPGCGRTDTGSIMHRAATLRHGTWDPAAGYGNDGALVERWIAAGCRWVFVNEPTYVLHPHRRGAPD